MDVLVEFKERHATLHKFVYLADELEALFTRKVVLQTVGVLNKYIHTGIKEEMIWVEA